jgi:hypothetical protein
MSDESALIHRMAQVELALLNIQTILVGIAALLAGAAMFALAAFDGAAAISPSLPLAAGLATFMLVAIALRPKKKRRSPPSPPAA